MFYYQRSGSYDLAKASREVFVDLIPASLRVGLVARLFGAADSPSRLLVLYKAGVVFGVMLAMRLGCMSQTDTILNAQKLRGLAVEKSNLVKRITAYAPLAVPVILGAFRNSEQLEIVLACRGFMDVTERTTLYEITWQPSDWLAMAVMAAVILVSIGLRVTGLAALPT
jgi:energy-coupling factor transport system permease protein